MVEALTAATIAAVVALAALLLLRLVRARRDLGTPADQATYRTLHTASQASPALRAGLTEASAERAIKHLRALLGTPAVALTDVDRVLAWDGAGSARHMDRLPAQVAPAVTEGRTVVLSPDQVSCGAADCPVRHAVVVPLATEDRVWVRWRRSALDVRTPGWCGPSRRSPSLSPGSSTSPSWTRSVPG